MPLIKIEQVSSGATLGMWRATESNDWFLERLPERLLTGYDSQKFSDNRKREFLGVRFLLSQMLKAQTLAFDIHKGKLSVAGGIPHISISHCREIMAAMVCEHHAVGIDVEAIHPRIKKVLHRFLNREELSQLGEEPELWRATLAWSAKESIYKMADIRGMSFAGDMNLKIPAKPDAISFDASVRKHQHRRNVTVFFEQFDDFVLTYCVDSPH